MMVPSPAEALAALAERQRGPHRLRQPVALVGPREATAAQMAAAHRIARALAAAGMHLVCGGKIGVMEAAARGAADGGGICIGLLPEEDAGHANPYLTVALPTGMGLSRNMLVARSALCLVAVGGGLGTLSEMAMALQWRKPVYALLDAPQVAGARRFDDDDQLLDAVARWLSCRACDNLAAAVDLGG